MGESSRLGGPEQFHTVRGYQMLEQQNRLLTPAMEDYLEMIYRSSLIDGYVRINTLSELLNVQAPSSTKMVQKLTKLGLLDYKRYGIIFMTDSGRQIGSFLLERHRILESFLRNLGADANLLLETELIEHNVTPTTLTKIDCLNRFFSQNPDVLLRFSEYRSISSPATDDSQQI